MQWGGSGRPESASRCFAPSSARTTWTTRRAGAGAGQPARRLRRALHPALGERRTRLDLRPGDRRGRSGRTAEPLPRQHRRRPAFVVDATLRFSSSTPTRPPAAPSASRMLGCGLSPSHLHRRLHPARRSARPSGRGRRAPDLGRRLRRCGRAERNADVSITATAYPTATLLSRGRQALRRSMPRWHGRSTLRCASASRLPTGAIRRRPGRAPRSGGATPFADLLWCRAVLFAVDLRPVLPVLAQVRDTCRNEDRGGLDQEAPSRDPRRISEPVVR